MKIEKLSEYGYGEAVLGFSLSYNTSLERARALLPRYAFGVPGENKFLESIVVYLDVTAPRFWWQEADTYRVGSTKQSESTMHTLSKKEFDSSMFEFDLGMDMICDLNDILGMYKEGIITLDIFKSYLPEGFLQRRIWCLNYKCLQNMYNQRKNHRLPQWKQFSNEILTLLDHPEFILPLTNE